MLVFVFLSRRFDLFFVSSFLILGEVSGENVSAGSGSRGPGDRGETADLGAHTESNDGTTLAANTAVDARGGSPQGAHLTGAVTPRPPRGRRRQNQNGLDTAQVCCATGGRVCNDIRLNFLIALVSKLFLVSQEKQSIKEEEISTTNLDS